MKVILVSTESKVKSGEIYHDENGDLKISKETNRDFTGNHLYFISDEDIEADDFFYDKESLCIKEATGINISGWSLEGDFKCCYKVIATTDMLLIGYTEETHPTQDNSKPIFLPKIPQLFVEEYVDSNGKIDEVKLEYDKIPVDRAPNGWDCFLTLKNGFEVIIKQDSFKNKDKITNRVELIKEVLNSSKKSLEKTKKGHEKMIEDYEENGFGDMHPGNIESYKTGLAYTHGYTIGHLELLKQINSLLDMSKKEIKDLIKKNREISAENKKHMDDILKEIKNKK